MMKTNIDRARAETVINNFRGRRVMIIGDMVADIYLTGNISRISREAPVLVLEQADEKIVAGGAANVANNVATLGGEAYMIGLVGSDEQGEHLKNILVANGAVVSGVIASDERPTVTKTRIIAGGRATVSQQIVRIDRESQIPLSATIEQFLLGNVRKMLPHMEGVILSDYGSGAITSGVLDYVFDYCRKHNLPTIADSRYDIARFVGVDYVKQNDAELSAAVDRELTTDKELTSAGEMLRQQLSARGILVTRGERGMMLLEELRRTDVPVSDKSEVYDVSGAGDTCVAAFMSALTAGATPAEATVISNLASGIAVRKLGTATVSQDELLGVAAKSL